MGANRHPMYKCKIFDFLEIWRKIQIDIKAGNYYPIFSSAYEIELASSAQ